MVQLLQPNGWLLVWEMRQPEAVSVRVGRNEEEWSAEFPATEQGGRYTARVDGLEPGQQYYWELFTSARGTDEVLSRGRVRTTPGRDATFQFLAFGDSGAADSNQNRLADLMLGYDFDLIVHTGDVVQGHGEKHYYPARFYRPYAEHLRQSCVFPCIGNHDVDFNHGEPYFAMFVLPEDGPADVPPERHYWFDYGDVRFVSLDSNDSFEHVSEHVVPWLNELLTDAGDRWKILYFHHPMYTNGEHDPSGRMRSQILPIIDRHHVDVGLIEGDHRTAGIDEPGRRRRQRMLCIGCRIGDRSPIEIRQRHPLAVAVGQRRHQRPHVLPGAVRQCKRAELLVDGLLGFGLSFDRRPDLPRRLAVGHPGGYRHPHQRHQQ
jgi:hypothetical protein